MTAWLRNACVALAALASLAGCGSATITVSPPTLTGNSIGPDLRWSVCDGGDPAADYNCSDHGR